MPVQNKFSLFSSPTSVSDRIRPYVAIVRTTFHTAILRETFRRFKPLTVQSDPRKLSQTVSSLQTISSSPPVDSLRDFRRLLILDTADGMDTANALAERDSPSECHGDTMRRSTAGRLAARVCDTKKSCCACCGHQSVFPSTSRRGSGDCFVSRSGP
jgi:hypothetical protein